MSEMASEEERQTLIEEMQRPYTQTRRKKWPPAFGGMPEGGRVSAPTAQEVYDRLREEWETLGLLSFTGDGSGGWRADLNQDDIKQIRALLRDAAATIEAYS